MIPDKAEKLIKEDFLLRYGIEIDSLKFLSQKPNEYVEKSFVEISFDGKTYIYFYKALEAKNQVIGYLENPSISPALVSYNTNIPGYTLTAYAGKNFIKLTTEEKTEEILIEIAENFEELARSHGELEDVNFVLNEEIYDGPAITRPDPNKKILFVDYDAYGEEDRLCDVASIFFSFDHLPDEKFGFIVKEISKRYGAPIDLKKIEEKFLYFGYPKTDFEELIERLSKILSN